MRNALFSLVLAFTLVPASGCKSTVPVDVADSIQVLRNNTHKLSEKYGSLLDRAEAPAGPAEETDEDSAARKAAWEKHKTHQKTLMGANNLLADKVLEWARVSEEEEEEKTHVD